MSYESVEPLYYGVIIDNITRDVDRNFILDNGRHFVGISKSLMTFPSNRKTIEFSNSAMEEHLQQFEAVEENAPTFKMPTLDTRTKEGLDLKLHFAFQYQLIK